MFKFNNTVYAGISSKRGLDAFLSSPSKEYTGFIFKDIRNNKNLGNTVILTDDIDERFLLELEEEYNPPFIEKDDIIYAGLENIEAVDLYLLSEHKFTGKEFQRIHDGFRMGNSIKLGMDWSYLGDKSRIDKNKFYRIVEVTE